jgi:predicted acyltransferase
MKTLFSGLAASSFALLSGSVLAHGNEAAMTEATHQAMHMTDAIIPALLIVVVALIARSFSKKIRQARIDSEHS